MFVAGLKMVVVCFFFFSKARKGRLREVISYKQSNTTAIHRKPLFFPRRREDGDMGGHRVLSVLDLPFYPVYERCAGTVRWR